jgi:hypothetical protein
MSIKDKKIISESVESVETETDRLLKKAKLATTEAEKDLNILRWWLSGFPNARK